MLIKAKTGEKIFVFRGSDDTGDWVENIVDI
jgi:hypothetical protein